MFEFMIQHVSNPRSMAMLFAAIAAVATVLTLAMPLLATDTLAKRMKTVAVEREKMRQRERERMARGEKVTLRRSPKNYMQRIVELFNLNKWVGQDEARTLLVRAGYRGHAPYVAFLFFRSVTPIAACVLSILYVFFVWKTNQTVAVKVGICLGATYLGLQLPVLFIKNQIQRRQQ